MTNERTAVDYLLDEVFGWTEELEYLVEYAAEDGVLDTDEVKTITNILWDRLHQLSIEVDKLQERLEALQQLMSQPNQ